MDIRSGLDGLKTLLGVLPAAPASAQRVKGQAAAEAASPCTDSATLSNAGSEAALTAADSDVRTNKVAAVQAALAAGTYHVPASAVASKLVDSMLGRE